MSRMYIRWRTILVKDCAWIYERLCERVSVCARALRSDAKRQFAINSGVNRDIIPIMISLGALRICVGPSSRVHKHMFSKLRALICMWRVFFVFVGVVWKPHPQWNINILARATANAHCYCPHPSSTPLPFGPYRVQIFYFGHALPVILTLLVEQIHL